MIRFLAPIIILAILVSFFLSACTKTRASYPHH